MDRCAVFVDAGYVYAAGGKLCCNTRSRKEMQLDAKPLVDLLTDAAEEVTGVQVLRTYWYDGAKDSIRTQEQRAIAALPDVKLRLGRLNGRNEQKGVDALIYRDMITLAQLRAVSDIVLVSGDEDLREGVRAAQDYGVRVVLVGITAERGYNQSEELTYEADRLITLDRADLASSFSARIPVEAAEGNVPVVPVASSAHEAYAVEFAEQWLSAAQDAEVLELLAVKPRIPRPLDIELMSYVTTRLGVSIEDEDAVRRDVRATWWGEVGRWSQRS